MPPPGYFQEQFQAWFLHFGSKLECEELLHFPFLKSNFLAEKNPGP